MRIFLTGLPGSGKSTLGKKLAQHLDLSFYDLDVLAEEQEGRKIREIFSESGEDYFRRLERTCLEKVLSYPAGMVLATGGGTVCFFDNLQRMKAAGLVVFLDVSPEEIATRMSSEANPDRPLFQGKDVLLHLIKLREQRISFYQQAGIIFRGSSEQELEKLLRQQL